MAVRRFEIVRTDRETSSEVICGTFEADYLDVYEYTNGDSMAADQPSDFVMAAGYERKIGEDEDDDIIAIALLQPGMYIRRK